MFDWILNMPLIRATQGSNQGFIFYWRREGEKKGEFREQRFPETRRTTDKR